MPVVHRFGPYRFYFHSNENQAIGERPHIHVRSGGGTAVFWLEPVSLRAVNGYTPREIARIRRIVVAGRETMVRQWYDFFGRFPDGTPDGDSRGDPR